MLRLGQNVRDPMKSHLPYHGFGLWRVYYDYGQVEVYHEILKTL